MEYKDYKNRLHLIKRNTKQGRGSAVMEGLKWGFNNINNIKLFIEMDCDFSHSPDEIYKGKDLIEKCDFVIGARYPNGKIVNWSLKRRIFSFFANHLARFLIDKRISGNISNKKILIGKILADKLDVKVGSDLTLINIESSIIKGIEILWSYSFE